MNPERMHDWLQIVGMAAVVASLIFVGLQLKQSQEIAIAGQYQARFDSFSGMASSVIQSDAGLRVIGKTVREKYLANESIPIELKAWAKEQPDDELAYRIVMAFNQLKAFDNLGAAGSEAQYESVIGDTRECQRGHRRHRWRACTDLHNAGAKLDPVGLSGEVS